MTDMLKALQEKTKELNTGTHSAKTNLISKLNNLGVTKATSDLDLPELVQLIGFSAVEDKMPTILTLSADKTTVSSGDTVTLTATLTDVNGCPISGETVSILDGDDNVLYTGITDKNGKINPKQTIPDASTVTYKSKYTVENTYISSNSSNLVITIFTADIYVSTTGNDNNTGTSPSNSVATLSKALSLADDGDIIGVFSGTYANTNTLIINKNITIKGQGYAYTYIQNSVTDSISVNSGCTLNLDSLQINGVSKSCTGLINNGTTNIINGYMNKNSIGIYNSGILNIKNSYIQNNNNGIYTTNSNVTITNSNFSNNSNYAIDNESESSLSLHCNVYKTSTDTLINCTEGSCP